jgi:AcrR family transcriptional regulator
MAETLSQVRWANPSAQARSQQTYERILDATEALMAKRRFADITVGEIVRKAHSSVGAFYTRFPDKDALLGCLYERHRQARVELIDRLLAPENWQGCPLADILAEVLPMIVAGYRREQGLMRVLLERASQDVRFRETWDQLGKHIVLRVQELVRLRRDEVSHPDPDLAVACGLWIVFSTMALKIQMHEIDAPTTDIATEELIHMLVAYMGLEPSRGTKPSRVVRGQPASSPSPNESQY